MLRSGDEWLDLALGAAAWKLSLCSPQALANVVWALAKLGYSVPLGHTQQGEEQTSLQTLMRELLVQCLGFGPQDCQQPVGTNNAAPHQLCPAEQRACTARIRRSVAGGACFESGI